MADHTQTGSISFEAVGGFSSYASGQFTTTDDVAQMAQPNLSPFFSHPVTDIYNADENPDGYWANNLTGGNAQLSDGWTHYEVTNTASSTRWLTIYEHCAWRHANGDLKGDTYYTVLMEFRNVTMTGNVTASGITTHVSSWPSMFRTMPAAQDITEGATLYFTSKTVADPSAITGNSTSTRTLLNIPAGASISCDFRVSFYEGEYSGPYKPYVDQSLITRVSTAETAIEQNAEAITLRATKTEAQQIAQPNLSPWFSLQPIENDTEHWNINNGNTTFTPLEDGWVHLHNDNSSGTGVKRTDYQVMGSPSVTPGADYTWLFEYRNNNSTGNNQNYIVQSSERVQFWGNNVVKVLEGKSGGATTTLGPNQDFPPGTDGVYVKRVLKKAEAATSSHLDRTGTLYLGCLVCYAYAGSVADYDLRVSIYEGEYTGPYKPYTGTQLYASQAQLKVANDEIDLRVEKSGVIAAINASTEAEGGSAVKIQADKVAINGTAVFSAIEDQLNSAYDTKGAAATVQGNLDNLTIGGTNLLRSSGVWEQGTWRPSTGKHLASTTRLRSSKDGWYVSVEPNATYVVSRHAVDSSVDYYVVLYAYDSSGAFVLTDSVTEWITSFPYTYVPATATRLEVGICRSDNAAISVSEAAAARLKLERGNRATDWTPAPEDVTSRTQRIYYRTSSSTAPTSQYMPTAWVTETGDKWAANSTTVANWTAKATKLTNGTTKYPYLFTCEQRQMGDGTLAYTTVLLDETTTVIDGGTIITGSVHANSLDADSVKANIVQTTDLSATKITSGDIATERMSANIVNAVKAKVSDLYALVAKIGGFVIDATSIRTAALTSNADNSIGLSTADFTRTVNGTSRAGLRFAIGDKFGVTGDGTLYANGANITSINAGNISSGSITADRIKANVISAVNNGTGTINADKVNVSAITIGQSQVTNLTTDLGNKANSSDLTAETSKRKATYGTCSTAAGTADKVVTCANFELYAGAAVTVTFSTANTAVVPKLNVNSTGAVAVWYNNAAASNDNPVLWGANATLTFVYDGSHWVLDEKPPTYAVACSTAAATRDKAATVTGALVVNGTTVAVSFSTANTYVAASLGFNLSGTGDDVIRVDGAVTSASHTFTWAANTTLTLVRRGLCWDVTSNDQASKTATTYLTEGTSNGLMVHRSNNATTGVKITDDVDIVRNGSVMTKVDENGMTLYDGNGTADGNVVASFGKNLIELGNGSKNAVVKMCGGLGELSVENQFWFSLKSSQWLSLQAEKCSIWLGDETAMTPSGQSYYYGNVVIESQNITGSSRASRIILNAQGVDDQTASIDMDAAEVNVNATLKLSTPLDESYVGTLPASKIGKGVFDAVRIPLLDAEHINSGTFDVARIPNLDASKINAGTFDAARIPSLNASKINAGTFNAARIPNLNASKITAGTLNSARLPTVPVNKGGTGQTGVTTVTDVASFIAAASGVTVSSVRVTVWGKLVHAYVTAKPDAAKTSAWVVGTVVDAYRPNAVVTGKPYYTGVDSARIQTNGQMQITACGAVEVGVSFTYLLA